MTLEGRPVLDETGVTLEGRTVLSEAGVTLEGGDSAW